MDPLSEVRQSARFQGARALRSGAEAIVRIAERASHESDAAFSAFKRESGTPPAAWRRQAAPAG